MNLKGVTEISGYQYEGVNLIMRILSQTSSCFFSNLFYLKRYFLCVSIHPLLVVHPSVLS